ncbi:MAG: dephospho-CoA kinase [Clostridia bacterium]|nr:dephospho-CoA kinase [Clostridia bacterium]
MIRLAITGPSGSGKGYLCAMLKDRGIPCLDCDRVVHEIYKDPAFTKELSQLFMTDLADASGAVDRAKLRALVFGSDDNMKALMQRVYPAVRARCAAFLQACAQEGKACAAVDAPQLFEAGFGEDYDVIVAVLAPLEERVARIMKRDGIRRVEAFERIAHQMTDEEYAKRSDAVIRNGSADDAREALKSLLAAYGVAE